MEPDVAAPAEPLCLINGQIGSALPVDDRGLAYGDGLFETIRVRAAQPTLLDYHLRRLRRGAEQLRLELDWAALQSELLLMASQSGVGVVKLIVTRGSGQRGYSVAGAQQPLRIVMGSAMPEYPPDHQSKGVELFSCQTRLASQPLLAGLKHLNRLEQVLARSEWLDSRYAEGLMCDQHDRIIECTMSNLFLRWQGHWITPDLSESGVRGVMRDYLIDRLAEEGDPVSIVAVDQLMLHECSELFCCNSLYGVWPIVAMNGLRWPVGQATLAAQQIAKQALL